LKELMKSKQHTTVAAVACHPSCTAGMLNVMSMHEHPAVRKCVACHPNTHLTTLMNLHGDTSKHVRTAVSENPNIPKNLKNGLNDTADRSEEMPVHSDDPRYDFLGESEESPYYWKEEGGFHIMRQKRFKDRLERGGNEHPHDIMAIARDDKEKGEMHRIITGKDINESENYKFPPEHTSKTHTKHVFPDAPHAHVWIPNDVHSIDSIPDGTTNADGWPRHEVRALRKNGKSEALVVHNSAVKIPQTLSWMNKSKADKMAAQIRDMHASDKALNESEFQVGQTVRHTPSGAIGKIHTANQSLTSHTDGRAYKAHTVNFGNGNIKTVKHNELSSDTSGLNESEFLSEDFSKMPRATLVRKYKDYATKAIEHHKALNDPHPVFPKTVEGWHKLRLDHFLHGAKEIKKELEDRRANGIRESHEHENRPMAASGLTSYRHPSAYGGYVMIGAKNHEDALKEASRSTRNVSKDKLEVWNGSKYVKAHG